jgi:hypothetical protein
MSLNEFRRTLAPGVQVRFFNLKRYVVGKVTKVNTPMITIDVTMDGKTTTYTEHRKHLTPPLEEREYWI